MSIFIEWAAQSDVGRQRDHNEDSYLVDEDEQLWILADGMGGHQGGEDASQIAVESVYHYLLDLYDDPEVAGRFSAPPGLSRKAQAMSASIQYANERILVEALKDPSKTGMGTTIVSCYREGEQMIFGYVGDSRIYRFYNHQIEQVSVDHSLLNHLLATGKLTEENSHTFTQTNVILRALGLKEQVEVDIKVQPIRSGEMYLMCSDGLSDLVDNSVIAQVLSEAGNSLEQAIQKLILLANANGGKDNITIIVLRLLSDDQPQVVM